MQYLTVPALLNFLIYFFTSLVLLALFLKVYTWITPHCEFTEIRAGNKSAALALGGALLGFTFPLLAMSFYGLNFVDFVIWSLVAGLTQLVLFKILNRLLPLDLESDNEAVALYYAVLATCTGLMNAFALIPHSA